MNEQRFQGLRHLTKAFPPAAAALLLASAAYTVNEYTFKFGMGDNKTRLAAAEAQQPPAVAAVGKLATGANVFVRPMPSIGHTPFNITRPTK